MSDIECPYCGEELNIRHDGDGYEYQEDELHQQQCSKCEKVFVFTTSVTFSYDAQKADCLNDAGHKWKPTDTYPFIATRMVCEGCGEERSPTKEEWLAMPQRCPQCKTGKLRYEPGIYTRDATTPIGDLGIWNSDRYVCDECGNAEYWLPEVLKTKKEGEK